jgi:lipoprotein NlpI
MNLLRGPIPFWLSVASTLLADTPPIPVGERTAMLEQFSADVTALNQAIDGDSRETAHYSRRGDRFLFLGNPAAAVADFERTIALDPAQDAPHWRLGIAYYFAGQFAKSAQQFTKYHAYDGVDRENGIWKFMADVKVIGLERARGAMLAYHRFDREPFPSLYEMFAGRKTTAEFLADLEKRGLTGNPRVMFFAHYYAGINELIANRPESALPLLRKAVANTWGRTAEGGPAYMWQVARVHYESVAKTNSK